MKRIRADRPHTFGNNDARKIIAALERIIPYSLHPVLYHDFRELGMGKSGFADSFYRSGDSDFGNPACVKRPVPDIRQSVGERDGESDVPAKAYAPIRVSPAPNTTLCKE